MTDWNGLKILVPVVYLHVSTQILTDGTNIFTVCNIMLFD